LRLEAWRRMHQCLSWVSEECGAYMGAGPGPARAAGRLRFAYGRSSYARGGARPWILDVPRPAGPERTNGTGDHLDRRATEDADRDLADQDPAGRHAAPDRPTLPGGPLLPCRRRSDPARLPSGDPGRRLPNQPVPALLLPHGWRPALLPRHQPRRRHKGHDPASPQNRRRLRSTGRGGRQRVRLPGLAGPTVRAPERETDLRRPHHRDPVTSRPRRLHDRAGRRGCRPRVHRGRCRHGGHSGHARRADPAAARGVRHREQGRPRRERSVRRRRPPPPDLSCPASYHWTPQHWARSRLRPAAHGMSVPLELGDRGPRLGPSGGAVAHRQPPAVSA
jgi:hypothetical protein